MKSNIIEKKTIRFYTDSNMYKGWQYIEKTKHYEIKNWLYSGNIIKIGDKEIRTFTKKEYNHK